MNIEEYKKLARNKIEADALTRQVRDVIKITKWQKQDAREGFKETFKPLIKSQDSIKKSIDEQQNATIAQLKANQLALTQGLNQNRLAITEGLENLIADTFVEASDEQSGKPSGEPSGEPSASGEPSGEISGKPSASGEPSEKSKIAKFTNEYLDRYLLSQERQTILLKMGYDSLPSFYLNKDISDIDKIITVISNDLNDYNSLLKNTADFKVNNSGYILAEAKSKNPQEKTKENIEIFNTLSTYYTNLNDVKKYKEKSGSGITIFKNPNQLLKRLELLGGSILAGNNGVINEFSQIAHLLNQMKVISKKQLNDLLKTYITIR